ncbi:tetratricopeptide repeat protein [Herbaspirillum sp. LeCh32-8]|uniref:tetratricopeptide repeat protein n=1 Tax=Herbaspirillum sp. LeCh32-8 TaxID=2821356 RepID=UPI001AE359FE|nr:tetratricopeptide repeat protein [Herbaspirillum sp. LeCh32-8]MBP0596768.1 tetratricopeptide repeat protein [Herbaspirillum sp. LeCh32-8]
MKPNDDVRGFIEETFDNAWRLHAAGHLADAEEQYRLLLALDEEHAPGLHYLGILLHQSGNRQEALDCLQAAQRRQPDNADWRNDAGNVMFALRRYDEAVLAYQAALAIRPDDAQLWNNCGAALREAGRTAEAIEAFLRALDAVPDLAPAMVQLAALFEQAGDPMRASRYQCMAYVLPPHEGKSKELLGTSYYFLGRIGEAEQLCRQWLLEEPGNPVAEHMLAAYGGRLTAAAPVGYVEKRFDDYADHFDVNLVQQLGYRGPEVVAGLLEKIGMNGEGKQLDVLDIGCGTGLCAPVLAPLARRLDGVDLSENMLRHAAARGLYTQLDKAEAAGWMAQLQVQYDVVVACDVVIYCGRLEALFAAVRHALRDGGWFVFTAEAAEDAEEDGYLLHPSGRYRHHAAYVERCLRESGFSVDTLRRESIRLEMRDPVPGLAVLARA